DPAGKAFDPQLHEAIVMQPAEGTASGTVLNVVQKGYTLQGRLIRPARVIVAK
ncbi:MAG: grpE, partial [Gammaproteobacteria bacterium]|nr:grpE [Gammaproteobacteria bacterium]